MTDIKFILLAYALGAIPTSELGRLALAALSKRLGLKPREIEEYNDAADDTSGD